MTEIITTLALVLILIIIAMIVFFCRMRSEVQTLRKTAEIKSRKIDDLNETIEIILAPAEKILADDPDALLVIKEIRDDLPSEKGDDDHDV